MLTHLSIRNIVLIEQCDLAFSAGLSVLTGETGAGKSILLDALGLALGARSDASLIRHGEAQGSVCAEFDIAGNEAAKAVLQSLEMEAADTLVIRRVLSAEGKSRALVNDEPVSLSGLKRLGETLVEIQGQHDSRGLMDASTHRDALDAYGALEKPRARVAEAHAAWKGASTELAALLAEAERARREQDYLTHVHGELKTLKPEDGEEEILTAERQGMMQNEKLFALLSDAIGEIAGTNPASQRLRSAQRSLARSSLSADGRFGEVMDALDRAAEAADQAHEALEAMGRAAEFNPARLESVEERLFALKAAARKYNMPASELGRFFAEVEEKLSLITASTKRQEALEGEVAQARARYVLESDALAAARRKAAERLQKAIHAELGPLKMGGTQFRVQFSELPETSWGAHGREGIAFEVATNAGASFASLAKTASGGELSRFLLAMKVSLSGVRATSTLIFDEIDTGTGGAVAAAIGERLARLSHGVQVMVVTHLPQVAAQGAAHFVVAKQEKKGRVTTQVVALSKAERQEELARMLSGNEITSEARKAAKRLLEPAA